MAGVTDHYEHEFRMRHRDGHFVWVWGRGTVMVRTPDGKPEGMFGFVRDISERKAREAALQKNEELLERTGWVAGVGGWEVDLETNEVTWSAQTRHLHGVAANYTPSLAEAISFFPNEAGKVVKEAVERASLGGSGWDLELPFIRMDGRQIWVRMVGSVVHDEGKPARLVGAIQDVTDRILQRQALEKMALHLVRARDRADRANRSKSRFLAGMSHELRTPLNGILGYAELLRLEGGLNEIQVKRVDAMLAAGTHLLDMIGSVLEFSEIEAERIELRPSEVDLRALAATSLELVRPRAEAKGLRLNIEAAGDEDLYLMTDPLRLRQVLLNLIGNAVKFTERGGVVLRLLALPATRALRVEVVDSGPGIAPGPRARLFEDYSRVQTEMTGACEGAGLGLALSSRLMKLMGGQLGHDDNPEGGSIFWLELPMNLPLAHPAAVQLQTVAEIVSPGHLRFVPLDREKAVGLRILVVDDVAINRDIAGAFLRMAGHDVRYASGGAEAVAAAILGDIDLILMDVRMPDIDGFEATRRIRAIGNARSTVPILGLTAQAFSDQVTDCLRAGMDNHLAKPYTAAVLQEAVLRTAAMERSDAGILPRNDAHQPARYEPANVLPLRDPEAAIFISGYFTAPVLARYLQTISARCDGILQELEHPGLLSQSEGGFADAVHALAGSAGMLGFMRLSERAFAFEHGLRSKAAGLAELTHSVQSAITATKREICVLLVSKDD